MRRRRLGAAGEGRGWRRRATTARGVWLQCIFVERQVGRSPFGSKKWSTELTIRIPMQKSKDASRTQNPPFASYLRPSEGKTSKDASRTEEKRKNSPNTTYPCLCIFLHITTILIIKRLTCSCTLECLLGLYFLAHSPSSYPYFPNTSPVYLIFFFCHRARNNIQTRPPVPIYISKHVTRS
jgi:hypothetical protein